ILLLVGAVQLEQRRHHGVGVEHARQRHPARRQLLDDAGVGDGVEAEPAVLGRDHAAQEPEPLHRLHQVVRILVGVLELGGDRQHLLDDERADGVDQLVCELGVGGGHQRLLADGTDGSRAGSPPGKASARPSMRFQSGTGVWHPERGTNTERSTSSYWWMYRAQLGKTWRTATRTTNWASGYSPSNGSSSATDASPFTRMRRGCSKSMNSIPTCGLRT